MGIAYKAVIVVGRTNADFTDRSLLLELMDNDEIREYPGFYDGAGEDDNAIGFAVYQSDDYCGVPVDLDLAKIEDYKEKFKELTGLDAKVYLTPYGH